MSMAQTDDEWIELKKHMSVAISAHHERWDGKGYPKGLQGEEIPFEARIIAVADAYDAMTSDRPYRKAFSKEDAVNEMIKNAGTQFDPEIVQVFLEKVLNISEGQSE